MFIQTELQWIPDTSMHNRFDLPLANQSFWASVVDCKIVSEDKYVKCKKSMQIMLVKVIKTQTLQCVIFECKIVSNVMHKSKFKSSAKLSAPSIQIICTGSTGSFNIWPPGFSGTYHIFVLSHSMPPLQYFMYYAKKLSFKIVGICLLFLTISNGHFKPLQKFLQ